MNRQGKRKKKTARKPAGGAYIEALVARPTGEVFELSGYAALGMDGDRFVPLTDGNTGAMPHGSEIMMLPDRKPMVFNLRRGCVETLEENPYEPGEPLFPVAVFNSPGYVNTAVCAYEERAGAGFLPLFSYGAAGWGPGGFRSAAIQVDRERRQDLRLMPLDKVRAGVASLRVKYPENRLREHLEHCALVSGCPAAKNFFIGRCEAPLPSSRHCNARCLGCISLQTTPALSCCQERIAFTPTPDEIAEVALEHIFAVEEAVVSFGQGCEGDPLMVGEVIREAVLMIRRQTDRGTINVNTNAGLPAQVEALFDAGLDSMRVSMNSVREACYTAYFRPQGYRFADVLKSIDIARSKGGFVAINYLNCPGITDTVQEAAALLSFMKEHPVHLIQWRNLNYDPLRYYQVMRSADAQDGPMGMGRLITTLKKTFPSLKHGYFNPPKERFSIQLS